MAIFTCNITPVMLEQLKGYRDLDYADNIEIIKGAAVLVGNNIDIELNVGITTKGTAYPEGYFVCKRSNAEYAVNGWVDCGYVEEFIKTPHDLSLVNFHRADWKQRLEKEMKALLHRVCVRDAIHPIDT